MNGHLSFPLDTSTGGSIGGAIAGGTPGSVLFVGSTGLLAQNNASLFWDNAVGEIKFGTGPTSHIYAAGTTVHGASNVFAEFGEGRAFGNPTGTVTAALNGAGVLTGAYKYAYYETDVDGNATGLSPVSATINPAAQQVQVTIPRARPGTATRVLCRTVAGGSSYFVLQSLGSGNYFHAVTFNDNTADGSLGVAAPGADSTICYGLSMRRGVKFMATHPDQGGAAHDFTLITGDPASAASWGLDCYHTITARQSLGPNFYGLHGGASSYFIQFDQVGDVYNSTLSTVFTMGALGEFTLSPIASTSGTPTLWTWTGPAHTGLTAGTECVDFNFNLSRTVQFATGAITTQRAFLIQAPTYSFVGASTITDAYTLRVQAAPTAGTNATITRAWGIGVAGNAQFSGQVLVGQTGLAPTKALDVADTSGTTAIAIYDNSGVAAAHGGELLLQHNNGSSARTTYASVKGWAIGGTAGAENGDLVFKTMKAGTLTAAWRVDNKLCLVPEVSLATGMTTGFMNIPGAAGAPSGTPATTTGFPLYWDSTNLQLYVYTGGAWKKSAVFT